MASSEQSILDLIGSAEAPQGYGQVHSRIQNLLPKPLEEMTVGEVLAWQGEVARGGAISTAAGRYQVINKTLEEAVSSAGIALTDRYDKHTQDRVGSYLLRKRGYDDWVAGSLSNDEFINNLAKEWAGLPVATDGQGHKRAVKRGESFYEGFNTNSATVSIDDVYATLTGVIPGQHLPKVEVGEQSPEVPAYNWPQNFVTPFDRGDDLAPGQWYGSPAFSPMAGDTGFLETLSLEAYDASPLLRSLTQRGVDTYETDPEFDVRRRIVTEGHQPYWRYLQDARSDSHYDFLLTHVESEVEREALIAKNGSILTALIGGILAPENLLLGAIIPASAGFSALRSIGRVGAMTFAGELAVEGARQQLDPNATVLEGALNVGFATLFSAGLAGGISKLNANSFRRGVEQRVNVAPQSAPALPSNTVDIPDVEPANIVDLPGELPGPAAWEDARSAGVGWGSGPNATPSPNNPTPARVEKLITEGVDADMMALLGRGPVSEGLALGDTSVKVRWRSVPESAPEEARKWGMFYNSVTRELYMDPVKVSRMYEQRRWRDHGLPDGLFNNSQEFAEYLARYMMKMEELGASPAYQSRRRVAVQGQDGVFIPIQYLENSHRVAFMTRGETPADDVIYLDVGNMRAAYENKNWNLRDRYIEEIKENPEFGADLLNPGTKFETFEDFMDFVIEHERMHTLFPRSRDTRADVAKDEFLTDRAALRALGFSGNEAGFKMRETQRAMRQEAIDNALTEYKAWRDNVLKREFTSRIAEGMDRLMPTAYKNVMRRALAAPTRNLMEILAGDGSIAMLKRNAGETVGESVAMASKVWKWHMQQLKLAEDRHYEKYLGHDSNPVITDIPLRKSFATRRADGSKPISVAEFGHRATLVHITGDRAWADGIDEIVDYAKDIENFFAAHDGPAREVGLYGPLTPETRAARVEIVTHRLEAMRKVRIETLDNANPVPAGHTRLYRHGNNPRTIAPTDFFASVTEAEARSTSPKGSLWYIDVPNAEVGKKAQKPYKARRLYDDTKGSFEQMRDLDDAIKETQKELDDLEAARVLPASEASQKDYFTRRWHIRQLRKFPKTTKMIIRKHFEVNDTFAVKNKDGKWETVRGDPRTIDSRVEALYEKLVAGADQAHLKTGDMIDGMDDTPAPLGVPAAARRRTFNIENKKLVGLTRESVHPDERNLMDGDHLDLIETDPKVIGAFYNNQMGMQIEYARRFADPAQGLTANTGFERELQRLKEVEREAWTKAGWVEKDFDEHWGLLRRDLEAMRDRVMQRIVTDPSRLDERVARQLRNWSNLAFLGMAGVVSVIDAGRMLSAFTFAKTLDRALMYLDSGTRPMVQRAVDEVRRTGALDDVTGMAAARLTETGMDPIEMTQFERVSEWLNAKYFIANGLAPLTFAMRSMAGTMGADSLIEAAVKYADNGDAESLDLLLGLGIDRGTARKMAKMVKDGVIEQGTGRNGRSGIWYANTDNWTDANARRKFQAALHQHIDNVILVASAADKPLIVEGAFHIPKNAESRELAEKYGFKDVGNYYRVQSSLFGLPFGLMNYTISAMNKIAVPLVDNPNQRAVTSAVVMLGLGYLVAMERTPDFAWDALSPVDKALRAVDQSGIMGVLPEMMWAVQNATIGVTGVNPLPFSPKFEHVPGSERLFDLLGPGPQIPRSILMGGTGLLAGQDGASEVLGQAMPFRNHFLFGQWIRHYFKDDD